MLEISEVVSMFKILTLSGLLSLLVSGCATPLGQQYSAAGALTGAIVGGITNGARGAGVGAGLVLALHSVLPPVG